MGNKLIEGLSLLTRKTERVLPDIYMLDFRVVNAFIISFGSRNWVLADTGLENSDEYIISSAEDIFGAGTRPQAIVLTHGHFDHVGSLKALTMHWDVPAYIHKNELAYITGQKNYPLPDDDISEGAVAKISDNFPHSAIDIGDYATALPDDNSVPFCEGWRWVFTPGHTLGHVSLFRESDRTLIAGDAISTVRQESLWSVMTQKQTVAGPPSYLTEDFDKATESIETLLRLEPALMLPSHGRPAEGEAIKKLLHQAAISADL
jgi:glyoxylase-like metal-dependent hydrolase (beta-lactamase superfamily II)